MARRCESEADDTRASRQVGGSVTPEPYSKISAVPRRRPARLDVGGRSYTETEHHASSALPLMASFLRDLEDW